LRAYPIGRLYVIVDNASNELRTWIARQSRLELIYLPTYSGHQLNPVEKVWWALKGEIAANRCFRPLPELDGAIQCYFAKFSPTQALALVNLETVRQAQAALG
jgi:transposase